MCLGQCYRGNCFHVKLFNEKIFGAVQKLSNGQRGEGVDDFVTYCYVFFEEGGGASAELRAQRALHSIFDVL